ncbi:MAG: TIGR03936 family radical SAM-associated protein [Chloroflexota bacterium]|nr:TIGR03936 family radical SAM-associated protein [Chloroflexota bacterium]
MNPQEDITRIRVLYTKEESLRFTGHLDMQRLWERLLRRSNLPVRYSQGFHPRARLNLASALPLGFVSDAELLDFWMNEPLPINEINASLSKNAPPGLEIKETYQVDLREDALQVQMSASEFRVNFFDPQDPEELSEKVDSLLAQDSIIRKRRKKVYDLRPLLIEIDVIDPHNGEPGFQMKLKAEEGATGRPDEVLDEMGFKNTEYLVCRTKLILSDT